MSTIGNLFSAESNTNSYYTSYADAFKTTDSGNTTISTANNLKDVLSTTLSFNQPTDFTKAAPWIALGVAAAIVLIAFFRGR